MSKDRKGPITVPIPRPFTRVPIKPGQRHRDDKNDFRRQPKHPNRENSDE